MFEQLLAKIALINFQVFLISMLFFFAGYALAPTAYYKKINWLTAYPFWIVEKLDKWVKKKWNPIILFLFLFSLNSTSLFINLLSGLAPVLPLIFAVWTGLNIGIITYHTLEGHFYFASLLNPVALFELPAAFISFTLALQYNLSGLNITVIKFPAADFSAYLEVFVMIVLPLLFISGVIETILIFFSQKLENNSHNEE